jgi:hypothetical protein
MEGSHSSGATEGAEEAEGRGEALALALALELREGSEDGGVLGREDAETLTLRVPLGDADSVSGAVPETEEDALTEEDTEGEEVEEEEAEMERLAPADALAEPLVLATRLPLAEREADADTLVERD